jgi:hypothetical protein
MDYAEDVAERQELQKMKPKRVEVDLPSMDSSSGKEKA